MINVHFGQHASVTCLTFETVFTEYFDGGLVAFGGTNGERIQVDVTFEITVFLYTYIETGDDIIDDVLVIVGVGV